ncbi:MAG: HEAT repeat domain-containing protein [Planctomycetia bacterium]|nr:HEAT repeat domain-containing protein [Planctomycetia bacterium]
MRKSWLLAVLGVFFAAAYSRAYVEIPYTLGRVVNESSNIVLMKVEKVNKERRLIYYTKVADLKGKHPADVIKHNISDGFNPREPKFIMDWAEPGKTAVFFYNGGASETCIGDYWYQAYSNGEWWGMSHAEPFMCWTFSGKTDKLKTVVTDMLAGKEVVVPCAQSDPTKVDAIKKMLHEKKAPLWRMKASLKITDYEACLREKNKFVVGLGALGPEAVPAFIDDLKKDDSGTRLKAAVELGQIGEDAKEALPALEGSLKDKDAEVRMRAAEALVRIDPKNATGVPALIESLKDERLRVPTIDILGSLGEPAKPAVPNLVAALQDQRVPVQIRSAAALLQIEKNSDDAIKALIRLVDGASGAKAGWTVLEPTDLKATSAATLTKQEDNSVLVGGETPAKDTYTFVLKTDRKAITAVKLEALADPKLPAGGPGRAGNGNFVLTRFAVTKPTEGAEAKPIKWAGATANFGQQGFDVGNVAAENGTGWAVAPEFGKNHTAIFTPEAPIAGNDQGLTLHVRIECESPHGQHQIGRFRISVTDAEDPMLNPRTRAAEMLGAVGAPAKSAITNLMAVLTDADPSLRAASTTALSQMAPDSIPVLAAALKDPKVPVRLAAIDALAQAGGQAVPAMPALIEAWKENDKSVRLRVGDLLVRFEGAAAPAAPALVASLNEEDRDIRLKACDVLGRCGGAGRAPAVPVLMEFVAKSPDRDLRARSAWVLGQLGAEAKAASETLIEAVKDKERDVRLLSLIALSQIGGDPKAIAPVALKALEDPDKEIRIRAADVYGKTKPYGGGETVELFEDNHNLLLAQLTAEDGPAAAEMNDKFSGTASIKIQPSQRYNPHISGWAFPIAEKPELGQYRYIRFAWKKAGGNGIMLQLHTNTRGWENRYCAGKNSVGWNALSVDDKSPGEWTVVTRDLFKDFGNAPFLLHGMALTPMDGTAGYFDHIYLGRSIEELDKITDAKKNK